MHFTRREPLWPREATPLMREFSQLFASLERRLDDWCTPEGQPLLLTPEGNRAKKPLRRCWCDWGPW